MNCSRCEDGTMYNQPQMEGGFEAVCYLCGHNATPPAQPMVPHPLGRGRGGTRYEPRTQGSRLKATTVERNKYGRTGRAR